MKRAFSFIELIVVLIILSIIFAISIPRINNNPAKRAAEQILSHIQYTKHIAMQDDKTNQGKDWYKKRWSIVFSDALIATNRCDVDIEKNWKYSIYSDISLSGNLNSKQEVARNPMKPNFYLSPGWSGISAIDCKRVSPELNIGKKFGITDVVFKGECGKNRAKTLAFDEFGRPMRVVSTTKGGGAQSGYDRLLKDECRITIKSKDSSQTILIYPYTGFACIVDKKTNMCEDI